MPRYFFHLLDDFDVRDEEGVELPDLDAARDRAKWNARFTAAEIIKEQGKIVLDHRVQIEDEQGTVLDIVRFRDVVKIDG